MGVLSVVTQGLYGRMIDFIGISSLTSVVDDTVSLSSHVPEVILIQSIEASESGRRVIQISDKVETLSQESELGAGVSTIMGLRQELRLVAIEHGLNLRMIDFTVLDDVMYTLYGIPEIDVGNLHG